MASGRMLWLDAIRAIACQVIVLHHLSIYGPVAHATRELAPSLIGWLDDYGRIAVQVFLVIGGFLFMRARTGRSAPDLRELGAAVVRRWQRLFLPFYGALALVLLAAIPARAWLAGDWVPQSPDAATLLAHFTGLYDYLGVEALSAGAWYVTIDLQLHALTLALAWMAGHGSPRPGQQARMFLGLILAAAALSLLWINRHPEWDVQPLYFFGSFALGIAAGGLAPGAPTDARRFGWLMLGLTAIALLIEWRLRIAVALVCAMAVSAGLRGGGAQFDNWIVDAAAGGRLILRRLIAFLADISYSLFLVHFAVCVLVNAVFVRFTDQTPALAALFFLMAWLLSVPVAAGLSRLLERPFVHSRSRSHG
jgi:peptidoglycan/LPS O-acetylase OafA/YrhL